MDHSYIQIQNVSKLFGSIRAVDRVSINIGRGEFFSLLGPSGCGKTTLLRLLAGFEMPDQGEIFIDNAPMGQVAPHQRPTNMVFQNYAIFPHLDVRANVAYGLRRSKLDKSDVRSRVEEALLMVKLAGFERRRATELSGGQRQRVALARALIMRPKVLLLDEPLGALDKRLREEMQVELRALQQQVGITFVFVTHDQEEALTMSDRIAVMDQGTILQVGPPKEIYERPGLRKVASFIGQMNLLEGTVTEVEKELIGVDVPVFGAIQVPRRESLVRPGDAVTVAIRPESLTLSSKPQEGAITVSLRHSSYYGESTYCVVGPQASKGNVTVSIRSYGGFEVPGDQSWLSWRQVDFVLLEA